MIWIRVSILEEFCRQHFNKPTQAFIHLCNECFLSACEGQALSQALGINTAVSRNKSSCSQEAVGQGVGTRSADEVQQWSSHVKTEAEFWKEKGFSEETLKQKPQATWGSKPRESLREQECVPGESEEQRGCLCDWCSEPAASSSRTWRERGGQLQLCLVGHRDDGFLNFILQGNASHWRVFNRILCTIYSLFTKSCYMPDTMLDSRQLKKRASSIFSLSSVWCGRCTIKEVITIKSLVSPMI